MMLRRGAGGGEGGVVPGRGGRRAGGGGGPPPPPPPGGRGGGAARPTADPPRAGGPGGRPNGRVEALGPVRQGTIRGAHATEAPPGADSPFRPRTRLRSPPRLRPTPGEKTNRPDSGRKREKRKITRMEISGPIHPVWAGKSKLQSVRMASPKPGLIFLADQPLERVP